MATLLLSVGGQFIGGMLGGPIGATIGRALGALAGSAIDNELFGEKPTGPTGNIQLLSSREGEPVPRIYGWSKISGNIIWATELESQTKAGSGAKALGQNEEEIIAANFAIALCEGEVRHIGRIWADGKLMDLRSVNYRFYDGNENQQPDSLIEAKQGVGNAPAYRGTAYLVFEQLDLSEYGNRIPQISVELCRPVGDLENHTNAVCVIPGATEFGYDPVPRVRLLGNGDTVNENAHQITGKSDWEVSLDELQAICPNLKHVALVISWFGDDLRCGKCSVTPRVMGHNREIMDVEWGVAGLARSEAVICSQAYGGPAFGGTPSDNSIIAAIKDLNARGVNVTIYPLMMMDIPAENTLSDPYSSNGSQAPYPWRGRITCNPAIGQPGSSDKTASARTQIDEFVGTCAPADFSVAEEVPVYSGPNEWSYKRFILHCANIARAAGGVDAFLVGSEMAHLSVVRDENNNFPFVEHLMEITAEVREILGAECKLTYAADWSEYHGYQPSSAPGDKFFHLDDLWAHPDVNAIGIDNYMPLADWRDFGVNSDFDQHDIVHDLHYLQNNIARGEGYDWFYASPEDRKNQIRTPIADGEYGENWVWRYKDLKGWWSNPHHHRINGQRQMTPTGWLPASKPIWFTELGCAAVGLGANEPNAFPDSKSVENRLPYFSKGQPGPSDQRQFLRAHYEQWQPGARYFNPSNNPISAIYQKEMLDPERTYLWAWDARPFPAFPIQKNVWSDGTSYPTGHWVNGRFGCATSAEFIERLATENGVDLISADTSGCFVEGLTVAANSRVRDNVDLLLETNGLLLLDRPEGLLLTRIKPNRIKVIEQDGICDQNGDLLEKIYQDRSEDIKRLNVTYLNRLAEYDTTSVFVSVDEQLGDISDLSLPVVMGKTTADKIARRQMTLRRHTQSTLKLALPMSQAALEVGDVIRVEDDDQLYFIASIRENILREITAISFPQEDLDYFSGGDDFEKMAGIPPIKSNPRILTGFLPGSSNPFDIFYFAGVSNKPWSAPYILKKQDNSDIARLRGETTMGTLKTALPATYRTASWDRKTALEIHLSAGHIASVTEGEVFAGENRLLVNTTDGSWEELGFASAQLIAPNNYRLTNLLRGLSGTEYAAVEGAGIGSQIVLKSDVTSWENSDELETISGYVKGEAATQNLSLGPVQKSLLPPAPVHLRAIKNNTTNDIVLSWISRRQISGDIWAYADNPVSNDEIGFKILILNQNIVVRSFEAAAQSFTYSHAQQIEDFGSPASQFEFEVAQISALHGPGHRAKGIFN